MPLNKIDKKMTRIEFAEYSCVKGAIRDTDNLHGVNIGGLPLNIKFQRKSKRNIKKIISWDKSCLHVVGINKAVSETDMKKLFPQAVTFNWKVCENTALIAYANIVDCEVGYSNAIKNKPSNNMKVFYKR